MKKTILLAVLLVGMTSTAFAATTLTSTSGSSLGSTEFKTSTNVTLVAKGDTSGYNCGSKHLQGDTGYISASNNSNLKELAIAKNTAITTTELTAANGATY